MKLYHEEKGIKLYQADNLDLLRKISDNSVTLIYCDIPYNTGKKFDHYDDNLGTTAEAMKWYRCRIKEMKRVLKESGSIFIHCNWRLDSYIRILMDEIFGEKCFRGRIYRKHSEERGFVSNFDSQVDTILYYVKDPNNFIFNEIRGTKKRLQPLFENGYLEERSKPIDINGTEIDLASKNKHWLITTKDIEKLLKADEIKIIDGLPYRFTNVIPIGNLWSEPEMLDRFSRTDAAEAYDTPKPTAVLERIIKMCSNEGDTVADFFLGGGTTAVVAKKMKRTGIFCDINEKACEVTKEKLSKII